MLLHLCYSYINNKKLKGFYKAATALIRTGCLYSKGSLKEFLVKRRRDSEREVIFGDIAEKWLNTDESSSNVNEKIAHTVYAKKFRRAQLLFSHKETISQELPTDTD